MLGNFVCTEHADPARIRGNADTVALCRRRPVPEGLHDIEEFLDSVDLDNAPLLQRRAIDLVVPGRSAGVGRRRPRAISTASDLDQDDRLAMCPGNGCCSAQLAAVSRTFYITGNHTDTRVSRHVGKCFSEVDIRFVAGADEVAEPHAAAAELSHDYATEQAALTGKTNRPCLHSATGQGRGKVRDRVVMKVCYPLTVGPTNQRPFTLSECRKLSLQGFALIAGFAET